MSEQNESSYGLPEGLVVEITTIQPRLYGFILKRLADHEQALEVLQNTNLVLCRKAGEFQKGSSFAAWAFTIAKFQVMAWRKSESRSRLVFTDEVHELLDREADEEVSDADRRIPVLKRCLERLREQERSLIQRRYCDGETVQALAQSLEKTVDATGMRLLRIRKRLGDCIRARLGQEVEYGV